MGEFTVPTPAVVLPAPKGCVGCLTQDVLDEVVSHAGCRPIVGVPFFDAHAGFGAGTLTAFDQHLGRSAGDGADPCSAARTCPVQPSLIVEPWMPHYVPTAGLSTEARPMAAYCRLQNHPVLLTLRCGLSSSHGFHPTPCGHRPLMIFVFLAWIPAGGDAVSEDTPEGRVKATESDLEAVVKAGKPEAFVSLYDDFEGYGTYDRKMHANISDSLYQGLLSPHLSAGTLATFSRGAGAAQPSNRARTRAAERATKWASSAAALGQSTGSGSLVALPYPSTTVQTPGWTSALSSASGYVLTALAAGVPIAKAQDYAGKVLSFLDPCKPRFTLGHGSPPEVLALAAEGVDLFDCEYPSHLASTGHALAFPVPTCLGGSPTTSPVTPAPPAKFYFAHETAPAENATSLVQPVSSENTTGMLPTPADEGIEPEPLLFLMSPEYAKDSRTLAPGCTCYTCARYTRAYIHHLLVVHEMTSQVLLAAHNIHHYLKLFDSMRSYILAGKFVAFQAKIMAYFDPCSQLDAQA
eukprot:gene579-379_t